MRSLRIGTAAVSAVVAAAVIAPNVAWQESGPSAAGATAAPSRATTPIDSALAKPLSVLDQFPNQDSRGRPTPELPPDFQAQGRYIVRDLDVNVPFTWEGRDGDSQMIAGGPDDPIWFTNVIYRDKLYTLTYEWPKVPPNQPCHRVGDFSLEDLNDRLLSTSRFVGREILDQKPPRRVNHWRVGIVLGRNLPPGIQPRFAILEADWYVARGDPSRIWQVLHFGYQNLYDPELDEWMRMKTFRHTAGEVTLPDKCRHPG
jgi:hypothetical protein